MTSVVGFVMLIAKINLNIYLYWINKSVSENQQFVSEGSSKHS